MGKQSETIQSTIERQLQSWTVIGPVAVPGAMDMWIPLDLDAAKTIPESPVAIGGGQIPPRPAVLQNGALNLRKALGQLEGTPQAFAFSCFETPGEGAVTLRMDVDYYAVVWVDGREIFDLRKGNKAGRHQVVIAVGAGTHTLALRIISGTGGWGFSLAVTDWCKGIPDMLRDDRGADWRNYSNSVIRYENRPDPLGQCGGLTIPSFELLMTNLGVDARWISVTGKDRGFLYQSEYLPPSEYAVPEHGEALKQWVQRLHQHRMCAMTWVALSINEPAWKVNPGWRQKFLLNPPPETSQGHGACCINSPYGDALIGACIETLQTFGFDGLWFDASFLSPSWSKPTPISCVCSHCAKAFKAATGEDLPTSYDWSRTEFRRWVQWRYDMFTAYWQRLVDAVHAAVPEATIVFNHYHRENTGWHSGIPLESFGHGFVSGTEADGEVINGAFYTRFMRAYGRPHTEVWMGLGRAAKQTIRGPQPRARTLVDFALSAATAGGNVSVGGGRGVVEALVLGDLARELKPRAPYLNLPSWPYAALHLSQQTDTFVFGRNPDYVRPDKTSWYWNSLAGWHHLMAHAGLNCDILFDAHLESGQGAEHALSDYPILIMPLSVALSEAQYESVMQYVHGGGILISGPWFGVCSPDGEPRTAPLGDRTLFPYGQKFPGWQMLRQRPELVMHYLNPSCREPATITARPLAALPEAAIERGISLFDERNYVQRTAVGRGCVLQLAVDLGMIFREAPEWSLAATTGEWFRRLALPPVTVDDGEGLILGTFRRAKDAIIHVQQVATPWDKTAADADEPALRRNTVLTWRGPKPEAVYCCLPEQSPALPVQGDEVNGWRIVMPPFRWGQIVRVVPK